MVDKSSVRFLSVTEEELARIVLDIHDGPVQYLFATLSLLAQLRHQVESGNTDCDSLMPTLARVEDMVESSLHEIKSFLGTFRPPEFHTRSLETIVEGLVIQHEGWTDHRVTLTVGDLPEHISLPSKIAIYRILQEALSNAFRHSESDAESVKLWEEDGCICLRVDDNGRGFEPPPLNGPQATEREEHIGLRGMRDRIELLDGTFKLVSHPGSGTSIQVRVPVHV